MVFSELIWLQLKGRVESSPKRSFFNRIGFRWNILIQAFQKDHPDFDPSRGKIFQESLRRSDFLSRSVFFREADYSDFTIIFY